MKKPKKELTREQAWGWNELMVRAAFRYCYGRSTYIVGVCADWLLDIWPMLGENTRRVIQRDLELAFERDDKARATGDSHQPLGWDCDRAEWERVRKLWTERKSLPDILDRERESVESIGHAIRERGGKHD